MQLKPTAATRQGLDTATKAASRPNRNPHSAAGQKCFSGAADSFSYETCAAGCSLRGMGQFQHSLKWRLHTISFIFPLKLIIHQLEPPICATGVLTAP